MLCLIFPIMAHSSHRSGLWPQVRCQPLRLHRLQFPPACVSTPHPISVLSGAQVSSQSSALPHWPFAGLTGRMTTGGQHLPTRAAGCPPRLGLLVLSPSRVGGLTRGPGSGAHTSYPIPAPQCPCQPALSEAPSSGKVSSHKRHPDIPRHESEHEPSGWP